jgi:hypothetical protein
MILAKKGMRQQLEKPVRSQDFFFIFKGKIDIRKFLDEKVGTPKERELSLRPFIFLCDFRLVRL